MRDPESRKYRRTRLFVMTLGCSRKSVRCYLERCPQAPLSLQQVDPLIRELVQYRDLINYRTKEIEE